MENEQEIEFIIEDEENNELTMYSYISNHLCFEYFVGYEIASLLGYKNPKNIITNNVSKCNQLVFRDYPGVKLPELDPRTILITRDGVVEIAIKTRKRVSPDVSYILKKFGIDTTNRKCLTKEQQTLSALTNAFKTEKFEDQFKVGNYYLDLYFTDYKIVVECDENGHADRKPYKERERMDFVNKKFETDDSNWIRYNPDEKDFDISKVIGRIYRKINQCKETKEEEIKEQPKEDEIWWDLNIEEITGKFTTPPKDLLIEKLKKYNISDIARHYGISTNPVSKWLKKYDIDIKDFRKDKLPPKEELIEHFKDKNQTEVSKHYAVSNHVVRNWLKKYELDTKTLKLETKHVTKEELVKTVVEFSGEKEDIAEKLNITVLNVEKLIKTHNIQNIPSKEELESHIISKTKDDIAKIYNTTRTTLRKWLKLYELDNIRSDSGSTQVYVRNEDNIVIKYISIAEASKKMHISHTKISEYADTGNRYKGNLYTFSK